MPFAPDTFKSLCKFMCMWNNTIEFDAEQGRGAVAMQQLRGNSIAFCRSFVNYFNVPVSWRNEGPMCK